MRLQERSNRERPAAERRLTFNCEKGHVCGTYQRSTGISINILGKEYANSLNISWNNVRRFKLYEQTLKRNAADEPLT